MLNLQEMSLAEISDFMVEAIKVAKKLVLEADEHLYEKWKAGGFLVDKTGFDMCVHPNLSEVVESI